ncbi:MAG: hypothetical protein ENTB_04221 [Enterocloster aldenensis]
MPTTAFSFQRTDVRDIDRAQLVDRRNIHIDRKLPREQRILEFCRQTNRHPDCVIIDGVVVLSRFMDTDVTIEDRLSAAVRNA